MHKSSVLLSCTTKWQRWFRCISVLPPSWFPSLSFFLPFELLLFVLFKCSFKFKPIIRQRDEQRRTPESWCVLVCLCCCTLCSVFFCLALVAASYFFFRRLDCYFLCFVGLFLAFATEICSHHTIPGVFACIRLVHVFCCFVAVCSLAHCYGCIT